MFSVVKSVKKTAETGVEKMKETAGNVGTAVTDGNLFLFIGDT